MFVLVLLLSFFLLKGDLLLAGIWSNVFENDDGSEQAVAALKSSDGGYVLSAVLLGDDAEVLVVKLDPDGRLEWARTYGMNQTDEVPIGILELPAELLVTGSSSSRAFLLSLDYSGTVNWSKTFELNATLLGSFSDDSAFYGLGTKAFSALMFSFDLTQTPVTYAKVYEYTSLNCRLCSHRFVSGVKGPDGLWLLGERETGNGIEILVVKTDFFGNPLWACAISSREGDLYAKSIVVTESQEILVSGILYTSNEMQSVLMALEENRLLWSKALYPGEVKKLIRGSEGIYGVGVTYSEGKDDIWLFKLDFSGTLLWSRFVGTAKNESVSDAILEDSLILFGSEYNEGLWLIIFISNPHWDLFVRKVNLDSGSSCDASFGVYEVNERNLDLTLTELTLEVSSYDLAASGSYPFDEEDYPLEEGYCVPIEVSSYASSSSESECFVATVAYGGESSPEVKILKKFRDEVLKEFWLGRLLVKAYYKLSPFVATKIEKNPKLKPIVRTLLFPLVFFAKYAVQAFLVVSVVVSSFFLVLTLREFRTRFE